jgi:translation elongation factor EF-Tu-like GTPase
MFFLTRLFAKKENILDDKISLLKRETFAQIRKDLLFRAPFLMKIQNIFSVCEKGTVFYGQIEKGKIKTGDKAKIITFYSAVETEVSGVSLSGKQAGEARAGQEAGLLLKGFDEKKTLGEKPEFIII